MGRAEFTVFVAEADKQARDRLTSLLRGEGFACRAYATAAAVLEQAAGVASGCLIADARLPDMPGLTMIRTMRERGVALPAILVADHGDVALAVQAMKSGALEFIEKPYDDAVMLRAVGHCLERADALTDRERTCDAVNRRKHRLTQREQQVLSCVVDGRTNKQIGLDLGISPRTVEIHRANVMLKMQAERFSDLVRMVALSDLAA